MVRTWLFGPCRVRLGAWLLLMVISYVMVSALHRRAAVSRGGR
jgi:uncharacterized membrane protein YoaT (DUF817 family)